MLLGLCSLLCPWDHLAFCSPSPTLSPGRAHAHPLGLRCPSRAPSRASRLPPGLLSCAQRKEKAKQAQPGITQYCCSPARKQTVEVPVFKSQEMSFIVSSCYSNLRCWRVIHARCVATDSDKFKTVALLLNLVAKAMQHKARA